MRSAPNVRLVDNPGRIVSTGLNSAIQSAAGEIIVRIDAHTVYARNYIHECVRVLQESGADNVGGPWVARGKGCVGRAIAAAFQSPFCAGGGKAHDPNYEGETDTVYLGCWRRSAFDRFGYFDPNLVRNQDDELNFRIRRKGGRVVQSPRIESYYQPRSSMAALFRQYLQYGYWKVAVMQKHRGLASWRQAIPALFVSALIAGPAAIGLSFLLHWHALAAVLTTAFIAALLLYLIGCVASAIPSARSLELSSLLLVPCVIAIHHISYGLGFLMGVSRPPGDSAQGSSAEGFFTALTR